MPPPGTKVQKFLASDSESNQSSSDDEPEIECHVETFAAKQYRRPSADERSPSGNERRPSASERRPSGNGRSLSGNERSPSGKERSPSGNHRSQSGQQEQLLGLNDSKPPIKPRKNRNKSGNLSKNGGKSASRDRLAGLFTMDKMAYDAVLEDMTLTLNLCEGQARNPGERRKSLSKQNSKSDLLARTSIVIPLSKIYAVNVVRTPNSRIPRRSSIGGDGEPVQTVPGSCMGMMILTYERKENSCRFEERSVFLKHPSEVICQEWVDRMKEKMAGFKERPKSLLILIQVFSGRKNTREIYHEKVKPVFKTAQCEVEVVELDHKEHIKQIVTHLEFDEYDGIVVIGGDGTVKTLTHHLLCRVQEDAQVGQHPSFTPRPCKLPIGVIPAGTTNHISMTMQGLDDIYTACVHIILGHRIEVDIASIFLEDKFRRWAFSAQYGLHGNALRYTDKSKGRPAAILDHAYAKALSKKKLRGYEVEIRYVPVDDAEAGNAEDENVCRIGCELCSRVKPSVEAVSSEDEDEVMAFDPLATSNNSNSFQELKTRDKSPELRWRTMKGSFMSIAAYCYPLMCEQAPQGISKYTHYSDGTMDLVCVRETSRKDVIRHLKRGGSSKNQMDFPFIETYRVKQLELHQRVDITWKHKDHDYNEMDYQSTRRRPSKSRTSDDVKVVGEEFSDSSDDDDDDEIDDYEGDDKSSTRGSTRDDGSYKAEEEDSEDEEKKKKKKKNRLSIFSRQGSLLDLTKRSPKSEKAKSLKSRRMSEPKAVVSKTSLTELEAKKRKEKKTKKEKKNKAKDEGRMRAMWNIDGDLEWESDLQIRVHHRLVTFSGLGIYEDAELGDCKFHYLPVY